jgi:predicted transcriptional regulator
MTETDPDHIDPIGRTLHIRLVGADGRDSMDEFFAALDSGDDIEPGSESDPVLRVESLATLSRVLRETNLELLNAIAEHEPESVRALARAVDRGPKEVLRNLEELQDYGLVAFEEDGRAKRPSLPYEEIDIDIQLPLPHSAGGLDSVASS